MANVTENNGRDKDNINTSGIQFSNKDGFVSSALVLGYWNDKLSIKLHPALEASKQTENNTFDYERATITSLTVEKMQTLLNGIEDFIFPAITAGEEKNISVIVNLSSLVTIGTGLSLTGKITPYLMPILSYLNLVCIMNLNQYL
jgi:hypothetical protein